MDGTGGEKRVGGKGEIQIIDRRGQKENGAVERMVGD